MVGHDIFKINSSHLFVSTFHISCLRTVICIKNNPYSFRPYGLRSRPGLMFTLSIRLIFCPVCCRIAILQPPVFLSISSIVSLQQYFHLTFLTSNPLSHSSNYICGITKLCVSLTNCRSNTLFYDSHNTQRMYPYPALRYRTVY